LADERTRKSNLRILIGLTYYPPYSSGLSLYAERLAKSLVKHGHDVTILTSQFNPKLKLEEKMDGVRVVRVPVAFRFSKGLLMPKMMKRARFEIKSTDIVNLHLPQLDAAYISRMCRSRRIPVVSTYHCDMQLPKGFVNRLANQGSNIANHITAGYSDMIVTNTIDYAETSPFLSRYIDKVHAIPPPFELPAVSEAKIVEVREKYGIKPEDKLIGLVGRLASEKGAEVLARAMPRILAEEPKARVLHIGPSQNVVGEEAYSAMLNPMLAELGDKWKFLGLVEAMSCGTPLVTSDLPGMRQPVLKTGMGKLFPAQDAEKLAETVLDVLRNPKEFYGDRDQIRQRYSPETIAREYIELFEKLINK
jgi:glycosyltransferase involved in cell wall biosynthesis